MDRFRDRQESLTSFQDEILVRCPQCNACARVHLAIAAESELFASRRFICTSCAATSDWAASTVRFRSNEPMDPFFNYPLWLQIPCCQHMLWAYNRAHLDFLEQFVQAKLRERQPHERLGWANQSLASRLPRWMQSRKNRDEILRAIAKLRHTLPP